MKIYIIYDSKYGNTKLAAEKVLEGITEFGGFESTIGYVKDVDLEKVGDYDAIVLGAPNHMGRPSRAMQKFVNRLAINNLKAKDLAIFGTYSGRARSDRAVSKLEKIVKAKLPKLNMVLPGLSVRVNGVTGPIFESELPKCVQFGREIAGKLAQESKDK